MIRWLLSLFRPADPLEEAHRVLRRKGFLP